MDETSYHAYVQKKLNEKIDKLPVFEKPKPEEKAIAPRFIRKLQPIITPDGYTVQFECQVEGFPRPQITWFRQTAIIKPSQDFQMYYDDDNIATLIISEVFPEDAGTFTCVAKNTAGFASSTTELIVEHPLTDHGSDDITGLSRRSMSRESSLADILEGIPPTFSRKPKAQYVPKGTDVVVDCHLVAVPEPDIIWFRNGRKIVTRDNITITTQSDIHMYSTVLKIKEIEKEQEGTFEIVARNREGESSVQFTIKVKTSDKEPPQILEPLKSITIRKGETVVLSTTIAGHPTPTITWYKNGEPIKQPTPKKDDNTYSLIIINTNLDDTAEYTVKATNTVGTTETTAQLTVEEYPDNAEPPLFVERFEELYVQEKGTIRLFARVIGNPVPEVAWLRNNKPLKPGKRVKISYDGENTELVINNANSETDSGDYKCIASNTAGKASHGARVTVDVDDIRFTRKLKESYIGVERETIELECETSHTISTKWYCNNTEISGMDHRIVIEDGKTHKLVIKNATKNDEGYYKCTVKNQKTETVVQIQQTRAEFVRKLQDLEITEKEMAILEVEVTSDTANVTWYKDGNIVDETHEKYRVERDGGIRKLLIRGTSIHDEGEYVCSLREDEECRAEVTVIELPPEIIIPLQDKTVNKGEKTVFEIELTKGDALVSWFKDGKEIQFSEHIQLSIDGKRQKLKIYNTQPEDGGVYTCAVGTQKSNATLTVQVPTISFIRQLPEITTVPVNTDAEFIVELSREAEVQWLKQGKKIKKSSKYTIISEKTIKKLMVHNVTIEDEFEYSCTVETIKTTSKLKTGDKPSPPRGPIEISGMSATSFTLKWIPSESDGGSTIIEYIVEMKEANTKKDFKKIGATKGDITDIPVNYLEKDHGYQFRITARNAIGTSEPYIPEDIIVAGSRIRIRYQFEKSDESLYCLLGIFPPTKLGTGTPPSPPINLNVKDITSRSATLTWEPPLNNGGTEITGYVVEKKLEFMPKWEKVATLEAFNLQYTFENLKEKSDYLFRVYAENAIGLSVAASSEIVQLRTHATVPSPPTAPLEIRTIGPNAIVIEWGIPESDGGAPLLGYNIAIRDTKKTMWMEIGRVGKGVQKFTIRDLQEGHEYMIRIFAKNEIGLSDPLESDEPFKVLPSGETDQEDFREGTDREATSYSTETTTSWLREANMDADIHSYAKGKLLRRDEYFFRIWCYAKKLFQ